MESALHWLDQPQIAPPTIHAPASEPSLSVVKLVVCIVLATACSLVTAYYHSFASLAFYDDEGLMMIMVKNFLAGNSVYDRLHSIYGPAYYLYQRFAHLLMGVPVSTEGIRYVAIFFWLAAPVL